MTNTSLIKNRLNELKFYGMQHAFQAYLQTGQEQLSGIELLDHLLQGVSIVNGRNVSLSTFREAVDLVGQGDCPSLFLLSLTEVPFKPSFEHTYNSFSINPYKAQFQFRSEYF